MSAIRFLLFPFSLMYGVVIAIRNWFYDSGIFPSKEFDTGVIVIGNLSVGGTGKTPVTEYLIRLLKDKFPVATLSRGYKRHTSGFLIADKGSTSFQIGDESLQFKKKFPEMLISVDENRKNGIEKLLAKMPELKAILLDDALQHRRVKPGLSILLSDHGKMYYDDFLLPAGSLREWRAGKKRADVILVTKCPDHLSPVEKRIILKKIDPEPHQHVFFSHIKYGEPIAVFPSSQTKGPETKPAVLPSPVLGEGSGVRSAVLLTGISNPKPLEDFLKQKKMNVISEKYPDHHEYTIVEVTKLAETFNNITSENKVIITTEKDAMRLDKPGLIEVIGKLPVYYIPIEIALDEKEKQEFNTLITEYVFRSDQKHSNVH